MDIYIHKELLGFQNHLVVCHEDGNIKKVKDIPDEATLVYGDPELQEIAKLYNLKLPTFPPTPYLKALEAVIGAQEVANAPWHLAIPPSAFKRSIEGLAKGLSTILGGVDLTYYKTHYRRTMPVLHKMQRAKIDPKAWMVHESNSDLVTPHVFRSFEPVDGWFAGDVVYSKSDTRTGRLKVLSGPNILHLPKEQRNILASRYGKEGRIIALDYRALEPRVLLLLNLLSSPLSGNPPFFSDNQIEEDIYQTVLTELGITNITRDIVKEVILSQLYGAGHDTILAKLSGIRDPEGFIEAVNDFFGLTELKGRLLEEWEKNDRKFILNFFGRRVDASDAKPYILLNYFIQSTAVDVALYGFLNILRALQGNDMIVPIFILHDALILDVHVSQLETLKELCKIGSQDIPLFPNCKFPIKASRF
jgi:hypothetical protein